MAAWSWNRRDGWKSWRKRIVVCGDWWPSCRWRSKSWRTWPRETS